MNLDQLYNSSAISAEDKYKLAESELFVKIAADQNINLGELTDAQVTELYGEFQKAAEEEHNAEEQEEKKEEREEEREHEEKKEAAAREHLAKLAFAEEEAKAAHFGTVMAEAYIERLAKHAADMQAAGDQQQQPTAEEVKEASFAEAVGKVRAAAKRGGEHVMKAVSKNHGKFPASPPHHGPDISHARRAGRAVSAFGKEHKKELTAGGAAAAGAGGVGYAAGRHHGHKKEGSSNIDELALEHAVKLAHESGLFQEEGALGHLADLMLAKHTLGEVPETKLASTLPDQIHVRALEFLEAVGCEVNWGQG